MTLSDRLHTKDWTFSATSRAAQRRNEFALYVLMASLAMFFIAAIIGYLMIRFGPAARLPGIELPGVLWLSTVLAIAGSSLLWRALHSIRRERQDLFRKQLIVAFLLGAGFCLSQSVGLTVFLREHLETMRNRPPVATAQDSRPKTPILLPYSAPAAENVREALRNEFPVRTVPARTTRLDGILFVLVLLHALHFVVGMTALSIVTWRGLAGRYDHEYHAGVKLCAVYWRFLDVVWIALFGTFLLAG